MKPSGPNITQEGAFPKKHMIVFILFSILLAALGIAYLQLKYRGPSEEAYILEKRKVQEKREALYKALIEFVQSKESLRR